MLEPSPAEPDILPTLIKQDANASIEDNHVKLFCKKGPINREGDRKTEELQINTEKIGSRESTQAINFHEIHTKQHNAINNMCGV